jgi:hypothetical protein
MVARDGVEPPTPAFSVHNRANQFLNQQLNSSEWPNYCDHSVTSADVRLSVGFACENQLLEIYPKDFCSRSMPVCTKKLRREIFSGPFSFPMRSPPSRHPNLRIAVSDSPTIEDDEIE